MVVPILDITMFIINLFIQICMTKAQWGLDESKFESTLCFDFDDYSKGTQFKILNSSFLEAIKGEENNHSIYKYLTQFKKQSTQLLQLDTEFWLSRKYSTTHTTSNKLKPLCFLLSDEFSIYTILDSGKIYGVKTEPNSTIENRYISQISHTELKTNINHEHTFFILRIHIQAKVEQQHLNSLFKNQ